MEHSALTPYTKADSSIMKFEGRKLVDNLHKFTNFVNQEFTFMLYFANRLKSARKMRGWSLQDLADHMASEKTITKQSLSKYESEEMLPSGEVLLALAKALDVQPDYFLRKPTIEFPKVEFRKKPSLGAKQIDAIQEEVKYFLERYIEVEQLLNIQYNFYNPIQSISVSSDELLDNAVRDLQTKWNLGLDAIPNVIEMLESHGVRIVEIDASEDFDGMSTFVGNIPVVVLNRSYTVERKRFTALHELGHILLNIPPELDAEKLCNSFAGTMLLPGNSLEALIGEKRSNIVASELINIKEQFGISIQAIVMHAIRKKIITKSESSKFWRSIADNKKEVGLGSFAGKEKSYRFEHLIFRLAAEDIVSMSKAANLAGLKLSDFKKKFESYELPK